MALSKVKKGGITDTAIKQGLPSSTVSSSAQLASNISGSLGSNASIIRGLTADRISGSLGVNKSVIRTLTRATISGSYEGGGSTKISGSSSSTGSFGKIEGHGKVVIQPQVAGGSSFSLMESDGGNEAVALDGYAGAGGLIIKKAGTATVYLRGDGESYFNDGNVGIGTDNPVTPLHLYENTSNVDSTAGLTIEQAGSGDAIIQFLETGTLRWVVGLDNSDGDKFKISSDGDLNSNARLTIIPASGNVGIGTTAPQALLQVQGAISGSSTAKFGGSVTISPTTGQAILNLTSGNNTGAYLGFERYGSDGNYYYFETGNGSRDDLTLRVGGTVHTKFNTDLSTAFAGNVTVDGMLTAREFHTQFVSASIIYQSGSTQFGDTTDDMHSFTGSLQVSGSTASKKSYIIGTNFGIGTTSPSGRLAVKSAGVGTYPFYIDSTGVGAWGMYVHEDASSNYSIYVRDGSGNTDILLDTAGVSYFNGGNVGINESTPEVKLEIVGAGRFTSEGAASNASTGKGMELQYATSGRGQGEGSYIISYDRDNSVYKPLNLDASAFTFNTGKVGIGTATPTAPLDVYLNESGADVGLMRNAHASGLGLYVIAASGTNSAFHVRDYSNGTDLFRVLGNGNVLSMPAGGGKVGIGTTPGAPLHVASTDEYIFGIENNDANNEPAAMRFIKNGASPATNDQIGQIEFHGENASNETEERARIAVTQRGIANGSEDALMSFNVSEGGTVGTRLAISGSRVGIGTTTVWGTSKLSVYGASTSALGDPQSTVWGGISVGNYSTLGFGHIEALYPESPIEIGSKCVNSGGGGYSDFFIATRSANNGAPTTRLTITSAGYVGIGITGPERKLHVTEAAGSTYVRLGNAISDPAVLEFEASRSPGSSAQQSVGEIRWSNDNFSNEVASIVAYKGGSSVDDALAVDFNGTEKFRIESDGKVGIGTTTFGANEKLKVIGTQATAGTAHQWNIHSDLTTASSGTQSDNQIIAVRGQTNTAGSFIHSATTSPMRGGYFGMYHGTTGTIASMRALEGRLYLAASKGTVTEAEMLRAEWEIGSSTTVTNLYGLRIKNVGGTGGTETNSYGVHIGQMHGATKSYGIYQESSADKNFFHGQLAIGDDNYYQKFTLHGGNMYLSPGYDITWANGNAVIGEESYALEFDTYNGSALTRALTLAGDNLATFPGRVKFNDIIHGEGTYGIRVYRSDLGVQNARFYDNGDYSFRGSSQSDKDLKKNIVEISDGSLALVNQLKPKTYKWKVSQNMGDDTKTGFIAQDVADVFGVNESVATGTDGEGNMGINPVGLIAHLTKAVQELSAKVESLEAQVSGSS